MGKKTKAKKKKKPTKKPKVQEQNPENQEEEVKSAPGTAEEEVQAANPDGDASPGSGKKKRKRKKKKKKETPRGFNLVSVAEYTKNGQTYPPSKRMPELFPDEAYPVNETMPHPDGEWRQEANEKIELEKTLAWTERMNAIREASEIHRQVRQDAQRYIQPGMDLTDICNYLESCNLRLLGFDPNDPLSRSWGFPTGCSVNECAAHYTPNPGDKKILKKDDIIKFDFGTQINGYIIDCAWTMTFDPVHDTLMEAVKDATNTGVKTMGIDVRLCDVGAAIQEAMESYECEYNQQIFPVKCIQNLSGHSIGNYKIHAGNMVPLYDNKDQTKMVEGEMYAIETFGSTGKGKIHQEGACSHFMLNYRHPVDPSVIKSACRNKKVKDLYNFIEKRFGTLAWCRRWIQQEYGGGHMMALKRLCDAGIVKEYPPLCDIEGCFTAQYEHTIVLRPTCKEIVSRGADY
jgi:methionyl aminopeptidase